MKKISKNLKSIGYKEEYDLVEFWFKNESECISKLDSIKPTWGQQITTQFRWQTELGIKLTEEVRCFINSEHELSRQKAQYNQVIFSIARATIDFNQLLVTIGSETKHINDWLYTISNNSTYQGWSDLRGIDLHGIKFHSAELKNACFANADFSNSTFCQVIITNCNFPECNFSHSFLGITSIDERTGFYNSNFVGTQINVLPLGANSLGTRPKIREISYINLLVTAITGEKSRIDGGHTDFISVKTSAGANGEEQRHLSYISWYQDSVLKYTDETNWFGKIRNVTSALTTKNWRSLLAVFLTSLVLIVLFAAAYFILGDCGFNKPFPSFMAAIYYSVVTFSTLGYGDITPNLESDFLLMLVILEVFLGYTLLGVLLFVLSNRVNERKL
ncbi:ion channel [Methyloglobulus sp.]|uniref:ion channel n=1 Tax=Methyloglobulus sp. TaxID=2518622 RepID=UPI0032B7666F